MTTTRTLEQLQEAGSQLIEDAWQFGNEGQQLDAQRALIAEAYEAGRTSVPQQWEDAKDKAAAARRLRPSDAEVMTVWQSPSGQLHLRRSCSGAGPAKNMRLVQVAREPWNHEKHCRCLRHSLLAETEKAGTS